MIGWKPGDVLVCINDEWYGTLTGLRCPPPFPKKNYFYTLKEFLLSAIQKNSCVILEEVPCHEGAYGPIPWRAEFFRKIKPLTEDERREFLIDLGFDLLALQRQYKGVAR